MTHLRTDHRNIVELYVNLNPGQTDSFEVIEIDGRRRSSLALTDREVLIVTDVIVTPNVDPGQYGGNVDSPSHGGSGTTENRIRFHLNTDQQAMLHLPLNAGVVFSEPPIAFSYANNPGGMVVRLLGYVVCTGATLEQHASGTK